MVRAMICVVVSAAWVIALTGCAAPAWEASYEGTRLEGSREPAIVRDVSWDRLSRARAELEHDAAQSDVHPSQWPAEQRDAAKAKLLKGLQVIDDPARVEVLGRSEFRTTARLRPWDGRLARFGGAIGATHVVWASRPLGQTDVVVREPITTYTSGTDRWRDAQGRRREVPYSETSTSWVPIRMRAEQTAYVAYFLRIAE